MVNKEAKLCRRRAEQQPILWERATAHLNRLNANDFHAGLSAHFRRSPGESKLQRYSFFETEMQGGNHPHMAYFDGTQPSCSARWRSTDSLFGRRIRRSQR